jgi:hypothetical protein
MNPIWPAYIILSQNGVAMVHVTLDIDGPDLTPFLIPFTKVMHLIERTKLLNGLAKYSKLRELQNSMNPIWTADIILSKNGISTLVSRRCTIVYTTDLRSFQPLLTGNTVKTLITHTARWTFRAMAYQRLWVQGGRPRKHSKNPQNFGKIM